jgi:hypothetical protein
LLKNIGGRTRFVNRKIIKYRPDTVSHGRSNEVALLTIASSLHNINALTIVNIAILGFFRPTVVLTPICDLEPCQTCWRGVLTSFGA